MNQLLRFCAIGALGFVIDAGILQTLVVGMDANPYAARLISFFVAASATWQMNRRYTFDVGHKSTHAEWLSYIAFMILGALINYGVFAACIAYWVFAHTHPWLGVAFGSLAGLGVNFMMSRLLFRLSVDCNNNKENRI